MEEGDGDAALVSDPREQCLRLGELPVRRQKAAVLVGVGVADHDFLQSALGREAAAHERYRQQVAHDGGRTAQIVDGLEERHDRQRAALDPGRVGEEPGFLRQQVDAQDVGGVPRHAQDEAAEGIAVGDAAHLAHQTKKTHGFLRGRRQRAEIAWFPQRPLELGEQPGAPRGGIVIRRLRRRVGGGQTPQLLQRFGGAGGVLAQVEARSAEPKGFHLPSDRPHQRAGERRGACRGERLFHRTQVLDEALRGAVAAAHRHRLAALGAGDREVETLEHAHCELAERLARIACGELVGRPALGECQLKPIAEVLGDREQTLADGKRTRQIHELVAVALQTREPVFAECTARDRIGDERVAVAVATDPRAELEERRCLELAHRGSALPLPLRACPSSSGTTSNSVSLKKCSPQNTSCATWGFSSRRSPVSSSTSISLRRLSSMPPRSRAVQRGD